MGRRTRLQLWQREDDEVDRALGRGEQLEHREEERLPACVLHAEAGQTDSEQRRGAGEGGGWGVQRTCTRSTRFWCSCPSSDLITSSGATSGAFSTLLGEEGVGAAGSAGGGGGASSTGGAGTSATGGGGALLGVGVLASTGGAGAAGEDEGELGAASMGVLSSSTTAVVCGFFRSSSMEACDWASFASPVCNPAAKAARASAYSSAPSARSYGRSAPPAPPRASSRLTISSSSMPVPTCTTQSARATVRGVHGCSGASAGTMCEPWVPTVDLCCASKVLPAIASIVVLLPAPPTPRTISRACRHGTPSLLPPAASASISRALASGSDDEAAAMPGALMVA